VNTKFLIDSSPLNPSPCINHCPFVQRATLNEIPDTHKKITFANWRRCKRKARGRSTSEKVEVFAARHFRYWFYIGFSGSFLVCDARAAMSLISVEKKVLADPELVGCSFRKYKGAYAGRVKIYVQLPEGPRYRSANNQVLPRPDIN